MQEKKGPDTFFPTFNLSGLGAGDHDDSDNVLPTFAVNFDEMASPKLRQQKQGHQPRSGQLLDESDNTLPVFNQRPLTKFQRECYQREADIAKAVQMATD